MEKPLSKDFEYSTGELRNSAMYISALENYIEYLESKREFTGSYDDNDQQIFVGDKLKSEWNYDVIVVKNGDDYEGKLVCDDTHSCKDIPYALNDGKGFIKQ